MRLALAPRTFRVTEDTTRRPKKSGGASRNRVKDLSACGEVGDLTVVSDGYGKSDAHLPRFFSVSMVN